jgi:hypothetical protein
MTVFSARNPQNDLLVYDRSNPLWVQLNKERFRVAIEICYSSTLNECWTLHADGTTPSTTIATRQCPAPSAITFEQ